MEDASTICDQQNETPIADEYAAVKTLVQGHFPEYWEAVEVGLAASATLLLSDIATCTALIYVGAPSSGKTTVVNMFSDAKVNGENLVYRSDGFTPAAFVTHAAQRPKAELEKIDLLPKIKHKILSTPEMSSVFRGDKKELIPVFQKITRVLDGEGLQTDSGTHGSRGYSGDYVFVWLGCTTPFENHVWGTMAQLGSRLFFLMLGTGREMSVSDLVASMSETESYTVRRDECRAAVSHYLGRLFEQHKVRGMVWNASADDEQLKQWIARFAMLLANARGVRQDAGGGAESPQRANHVLYNLAKGRALVEGRRQINEADVAMAGKVAAATMPTERSKVFRELVFAGGPLETGQVQRALGVKSIDTARRVMEDLESIGLAVYQAGKPGQAGTLHFAPEWAWCGSIKFQTMLQGGDY